MFLEERLLNLNIKLLEGISFFTEGFRNEELTDRNFYCSENEILHYENDMYFSYQCSKLKLSACYRPKIISPRQSFTGSRCRSSDLLAPLVKWKQIYDQYSSGLTPGHMNIKRKRSIISLFGSDNSAEILEALRIDNRNILALSSNQKHLRSILGELVNQTEFLAVKNGFTLDKATEYLNQNILLSSYFRLMSNVRHERAEREMFLNLMISSTSDLIQGLSKKIEFLISKQRECFSLHNYGVCSFGEKEFRINFNDLSFKIGYLGSKISLQSKEKLVCTPVARGIFIYNHHHVINSDGQNYLLDNGIILDQALDESLFQSEIRKNIEFNDCYYALFSQSKEEYFLVSCKYKTTFTVNRLITNLEKYQMFTIRKDNFPIQQGSREVTLTMLVTKLKRNSLSYTSIFEGSRDYEQPFEVPKNLFIELLNQKYREKIEISRNSSLWHFTEILEKRPNMRYYFAGSLTLVFGFIVGVVLYCVIKRKIRRNRKARKRKEQQNNLGEALDNLIIKNVQQPARQRPTFFKQVRSNNGAVPETKFVPAQ